MKPATLAAAHAAVVAALGAGSVPVASELDRALPVTGPAFRVGPPSATAEIVGGVCAAWDYEVPVAVVPGVDTLAQLVADTDTAMALLAAANIRVTSAEPASRSLTDEHGIAVYDLTCAL